MSAKAPSAERSRMKFNGVEAGRAVAAIAVVAYHAGHNIAEPRFFDTVLFGGHLENFNVGIDFFFVLSGFIIAWVHWSDIGRPGRLVPYVKRRFLRIYPPYWGILIPLMILYASSPGAGKATQHDPANVFFSLTLLPYTAQPILGAAWTLVFEVMFYAFFGVIIWVGRRGKWLLPLWAVAIVIAQLIWTPTFPLGFPLSILNLEFLVGIATAVWLQHRVVPGAGWIALIGCASFIGSMLFALGIQEHPFLTRLVFGGSAALIILGFVELERAGRLRVPRFLQFLGAASYSIYLIHGFILSMSLQLLVKLTGHSLPPNTAFAIGIGCAVFAGCLYHSFVERPLIKGLRRLMEARSLPAQPSRTEASPLVPIRDTPSQH